MGINLNDIYAAVNKVTAIQIEQLYAERDPRAKIDMDIMETDGHDYFGFHSDTVSCDEKWSCFMKEASTYIKKKKPGYTLLIKDLRKTGYTVSRSGKVSPW